MKIDIQRIVGFRDIYGKPRIFYKSILGNRIGREKILQLTALMLTYCRKGVEPTLEDLLAIFFQYNGNFDQQGFDKVMSELDVLAQKEQSMDFGILSEEALLNMYIWAANNPDIPEEGNGLDEQNSPELLKLLLLFNDDVLDRFAKAKRIANKNNDRPILKTIFSQRFPQNDIIEIDYGKLIFSQTYKLMELLNFMEATPKYQHLYSHLLNDFEVHSKEEFFKSIGGAALSPLNLKKSGINTLVIEDNAKSKESIAFLDKLAHSSTDVDQGPTDYRFLRDKPLQKIDKEYRVVFDLFLIKKLYNGMVFKLSSYVNQNPALFKGPLFGSIRDEFTEAVLVYNTLNKVLSKTQTVCVTGNEFKNAGVQREPDYYTRFNKDIILGESKDFFMPAEEKLSYDFDIIMAGLSKDGRLKKATLQLVTNVGRVLQKKLPLDNGYDPSMTILPIIILHDSLYDSTGLNYWVNEWFKQELSNLKADPSYKGYDFSVIRPVTLVTIDTLILYRTNFEKGELNLFEMLKSYQDYVDFNSASDKNYDKAVIPFAIFADEYVAKKGVMVDLRLLNETYNYSGFIDE